MKKTRSRQKLYKDVGALSGVDSETVKKVIESLMVIGIEDIIETGEFRIPKLITLKVVVRKGLKQGYSVISGLTKKETWIPPRPDTKVIKAVLVSPFKELSKSLNENTTS